MSNKKGAHMKSSCKILVLIFVMTYSSLLCVDPGTLKGTYTILRSSLGEEYTAASPVHGAILAETGFIRNYYRFGNPDEAPVKLIKALFHEVAGSFNATRLGSNPGAHFSASTIGKIMGHLFIEYKEPKTCKDNIVKVITLDPDFKASLQKTAEKAAQIESEIKQVKESAKTLESSPLKLSMRNLFSKLGREHPADVRVFFEGTIKTLNEKIEAEHDTKKKGNLSKQKEVFDKILKTPNIFDDYNKYRQQKEAFEKKQPELQNDKLKNNAAAAQDGVKNFVNVLIETREASKTDVYFPSMTEGVLLGFLYTKAQSKEDFKKYFDAFFTIVRGGESGEIGEESKSPGDIPGTLINDAWVKDIYIKEDLDNIPTIKKWAELDNTVLNKSFEAVVFKEIMGRFYLAPLPPFSGDMDVTYKGKTFTNCMETTMLNLCNVYAYDSNKKIFTSRDGMIAMIKNFYDTIQIDPVNIGKLNVHQAWSDCLQNIPGVAYNRLVIDGARALAPIDTRGFIHGVIGEDDDEKKEAKESFSIVMSDGQTVTLPKITIAGGTYILIDPTAPANQAGFEVQPSLRNVIVIMNNLLGFELFEDEDFETAFGRKDFNTTYFPALCEKLEWECEIGERDLDKDDYTRTGLVIGFEAGRGHVDLSVTSRHGEVTKRESVTMSLEKKALFDDINTLKPTTDRNDFKVLLMRDEWAELFDLATISRPLIFAFRVSGMTSVVKKIITERVVGLYYFAAQFITALSMIDDLHHHIAILGCMTGEQWSNPLFDNIFKIMLEKVQQHANGEAKGRVFIEFVRTGRAFDRATKIASELVKATDAPTIAAGIDLFRELVQQGQAFDEAKNAVVELHSDCGYIGPMYPAVNNGFEALVTAIQASPDFTAGDVALDKIISRQNALKEKRLIFVRKIASDLIISKGADVLRTAINMFDSLVKKGQTIKEARAAVVLPELSKYDDKWFQIMVEEIKKLLETKIEALEIEPEEEKSDDLTAEDE